MNDDELPETTETPQLHADAVEKAIEEAARAVQNEPRKQVALHSLATLAHKEHG